MKIAMFGHKQIPSHRGGIEVAVEALAVRMAKLGHEVTLFSRGKNKDLTTDLYNGVRIRSVPVVDISGIAAVMGSLFAAVRAVFGRYDCIHIHAEGPALMTFLPHMLEWRHSTVLPTMGTMLSTRCLANVPLSGEKLVSTT